VAHASSAAAAAAGAAVAAVQQDADLMRHRCLTQWAVLQWQHQSRESSACYAIILILAQRHKAAKELCYPLL
jgi:hypothetical protein